MAEVKKHSIPAPKDPEMDTEVRDTLDFYVTTPINYIATKKYGLVFCIPGYGDRADSDYQINKLCPYIADKYGYIVVGVRYHNDLRNSDDINVDLNGIINFYNLNGEYFNNIQNSNQVFEKLFDLLIDKKIYSIDARLSVKTIPYHKYSSFGFMPAIDHLQVLYYMINNYNIDKSNIIAFGSSYGGYIASLAAKYAPQTFSMVIDNSGFCFTQLQEVFGGQIGGVGGSAVKYVDDKRYEVPITNSTLWSVDETSQNYFSDAHRQIRNLLIEDHRIPSKTLHCCFHSVEDELTPIRYKDELYKLISKYSPTFYKRVEEKDIDGHIFKNLSHAMNASLRSLFDMTHNLYSNIPHLKEPETDFDIGISYGFPCSDKLYNFSYTNEGLHVSIDKLKYI